MPWRIWLERETTSDYGPIGKNDFFAKKTPPQGIPRHLSCLARRVTDKATIAGFFFLLAKGENLHTLSLSLTRPHTTTEWENRIRLCQEL